MESLSAAWIMYANDNNGQLVLNPDGMDTGKSVRKPSWAGGWLDFTSSSDNTNTALLQGLETRYGGLLGGYVSDVKIFKCPEDASTVTIGNVTLARVRSISMNCYLGGIQTQNGNQRNSFNYASYQSFVKKSDLYTVNPSAIFQFIEESPESNNDGCLQVDMLAMDNKGQLNPNNYRMIDYPAGFHENGAALSFVDGHAELWTWRDGRTTLSHKEKVFVSGNSSYNLDVGRLVMATTKSK